MMHFDSFGPGDFTMRDFAHLVYIVQPRLWPVVALVFTAGIFTVAGPLSAESQHAGRWITNYGKMSLYDAGDNLITGNYFHKGDPAQIYAAQKHRHVYEGVWIQKTSEVSCKEQAKGSSHWGRVRFLFTGFKFFALWNYCDRALVREPNRLWEGILKATFKGDSEVLVLKEDRPPRLKTHEIFEKLIANSDRSESDILLDLRSKIIQQTELLKSLSPSTP